MIRDTKFFRFGPVRQETGAKHVRQGDLLEAVNVRQTAKAGVYAKRKAFARTSQAFVGGTLSGQPVSVVPGLNGATLMRDSGDQLWARSPTANQWTLVGTNNRPWPTTQVIQSNLYTTPQPFCCLVGSNLWIFALTSSAYEFTVVDAATGTIITPKNTVTATNIVHASAVYDGTHVWLFWVDNGANATIRLHKFTNAVPTSAPTATNYYTFPNSPAGLSTAALQQVQARYFSANSRVVVVACGGSSPSGTNKRVIGHSVLDPSTSLPATGSLAPAVDVGFVGATTTSLMCGLSILDGQDGSDTVWYYQYAAYNDSLAGPNWLLAKVSMSTSSNPATIAQAATVGSSIMAASRGYHDQAANAQYCWLSSFGGASIGNPFLTSFYQVNAGSLTTPASAFTKQGCFDWVATGFISYGGSWYTLNGFDDFSFAGSTAFGSEGNSTQRMFHLCKFIPGASATASKLQIVAQFAAGNAAALWSRANTASMAYSASQVVTSVAQLAVLGSKLVGVCGMASSAFNFVDVALLRVDTAKQYGDEAQFSSYAVSPGSVPVVWNGQIGVHEISPLSNPVYLSAGGGTGTDFTAAAAVYVIEDNDGVLYRSSPVAIKATIGHGAALTAPRPPHYLDGTVVKVEFYLATASTLKLQGVVTPGAGDTYAVSFTTPTAAAFIDGETLYTSGNALSATWPVACQSAAVWRNRLFLAQGNTLWFSQEASPGFGPLFNEVLKATWSEEPGDITAMAPVDWNYLGIASAGQVAVISGDGPNGIGVGNYVIKTLPSYTGVAAGAPAIQGPQGMYYQNPATGRIMCLQPSLQVMEAAGGAYDYASYAFTSAVWYEAENLMVFFAPAQNAAIAIDYQHPVDVEPFGQVYLWTFYPGVIPVAACRDSSGFLGISSLGSVYRTVTTQWYDDVDVGGAGIYPMKLATAELQLGDLQGSMNLDTVQVLLTMRGASSVTIGVYPGYASATGSDSRITTTASVSLPAPANSGDTETVMTRPANCMRIQSFRVVIQEGVSVTQGFEFEGLGVEYTATGRLLRPKSGRVV